MSAKQDRIDKLLNGEFETYEQAREPYVDLTTCFDIALKCDGDCSDICCDCCGDLTTTSSVESQIRIAVGTNADNFLNVGGIDWKLLRDVPLNSSGLRTVRQQFENVLSGLGVNVNVRYNDQQFCVEISHPDELGFVCIQTLSGEIYKLTGT